MHTGHKPMQATQYIMHTGYKGYKPVANNTICDLTLENWLKYQFQILKSLWFSCARSIVTTLDR